MQAVRFLRITAVMAACGALTACAGCGDPTKASASGKVTYKGQALTGGQLNLTPSAGGAPVPIFIKADGTFLGTDVPVGQYQVSVDTSGAAGPTSYSTGGVTAPAGAAKANQPQPTGPGTKQVDIPAKYKDPKSSGLSWEIKAGKNDKNFELTD